MMITLTLTSADSFICDGSHCYHSQNMSLEIKHKLLVLTVKSVLNPALALTQWKKRSETNSNKLQIMNMCKEMVINMVSCLCSWGSMKSGRKIFDHLEGHLTLDRAEIPWIELCSALTAHKREYITWNIVYKHCQAISVLLSTYECSIVWFPLICCFKRIVYTFFSYNTFVH